MSKSKNLNQFDNRLERETLAAIAKHLKACKRLSRAAGSPLLPYLIDMATDEAYLSTIRGVPERRGKHYSATEAG